MEKNYSIEKTGFNMVCVNENGKTIALTETLDNANRIVAALKLYNTLKVEFSNFLDSEADYTEYVGIESSWIVKLGYSKSTGRLVLFKKDSEIAPLVQMVYEGVPGEVFRRLLKPDAEFKFSVGAAYNGLIRGKYTLISEGGLKVD